MATLPTLLGRTTRRLNESGGALALGVLIFGILAVLLQSLIAYQAGEALSVSLPSLLEREAALGNTGAVLALGSGALAANDSLTQLSTVLGSMDQEQRARILSQLVPSLVRKNGALMVVLVSLTLLIHLFARVYFQTLGALRLRSVQETMRRGMQVALPLIGAWIGVILCSFLWLPISIAMFGYLFPAVLVLGLPSFIPVVMLAPRFLIAPVIVLQERLSVGMALRESFRRTRGRWWEMMSGSVGIGVVVWIAASLADTLLQVLVDLLLPYSPFGLSLYALAPFVALIASSYRLTAYAVLKEEVSGSAQ